MLRIHLAAIAALFAVTPLAAQGLRVVAPATYPAGARIPVRLEHLRPDGSIAKEFWSYGAWVEVAGGTGITNQIDFKNGLAMVSVEGRGTNDIQIRLIDALMNTTTNRLVRPAPAAEQSVGGTLPGASTTWSGVVRVTNDVTVPAGHTLRIDPGTLVLVEGATSGTTAPDLLVSGTVESLGTEQQPVWITSTGTNLNWGQIRHSTGSRGLYQYTFIHKGGRTAGEGHTGTGPVLRLSGADVRLEQCVVSDLWNDAAVGKGMYARDSDLVLDSTVFAQMRMGPEIEGTSLLCTNSYFLEMRGPDDCDGIYLHDSDGKSLRLVDSVFIGGDDDAVDTLSSDVVITNCIFRGWLNETEDAKAVSVFNGRVQIQRCLIADCYAGVSAKTGSGNTATVLIDQTTIVTKTNGVAAAWKSNAPGPAIDIHVTNSIIQASPAILSNFGTTNVSVGFSLLSTAWDGLEISLADPRFMDPASHDYRLRSGSPAIDSGHPEAQPDSDGTRADIGSLTFLAPAATTRLEAGVLFITLQDVSPGRTVVVETSDNLHTWTEAVRSVAKQGTLDVQAQVEEATKFFRFKIE